MQFSSSHYGNWVFQFFPTIFLCGGKSLMFSVLGVFFLCAYSSDLVNRIPGCKQTKEWLRRPKHKKFRHFFTRYNLRSNSSILLVPSSAKCKITLGDRAFQSAAPKLWNRLPRELRDMSSAEAFKASLKLAYCN